MNKVYGYIRVSSAKQGEGVSLIEQKDAIIRYASTHGLEIIEWFEEKETAAKQGRPLFTAMMKSLKAGKANGVVIHKIDRSARNLRDWVDLGDMIDKGVKVHFAHDSLDLQTRGGRLSADIQAAIAADYIRNLREEAIKGLYGRLKQGIYPFYAPIGYLNVGSGKAKAVDPVKAPLVRKAFELYATGTYTYHTLLQYLNSSGLRNIRGRKLVMRNLTAILNNPFYTGVIKVKGKVFKGHHAPLISPRLFKQVQGILRGNTTVRIQKYDLLFRKSIICEHCQFSLIGEVQKGRIYYRCHTKKCPMKGLREPIIEEWIKNALEAMQFSPEEARTLDEIFKKTELSWSDRQEELLRAIKLQKEQFNARYNRLTDAYIDGMVDGDTYAKRKEELLLEQKEIEERERDIATGGQQILQKVKQFLELGKGLKNIYEIVNPNEKRELLKIVTSNLSTHGKNLIITTRSPFTELSKRSFFPLSRDDRDARRIQDTTYIYSGNNTCPIIETPLSKEQLELFFEEILKIMKVIDFRYENDL